MTGSRFRPDAPPQLGTAAERLARREEGLRAALRALAARLAEARANAASPEVRSALRDQRRALRRELVCVAAARRAVATVVPSAGRARPSQRG